MTTTDRKQGLRTGQGLKAPCVVASTAALTLSSTQVIDGIVVGSQERVLVKDQTDLKENGIWVAGPIAWSRAKDFDGEGDAIPGTAVWVDRGTAGGAKFYAINSSSTASEVVITTFVSSDADDKVWSLIQVALTGVSNFSQNTLFPLGTAAAWRSSDGLSAAPDPFGSTSVSSSAIVTVGIADNAVTTAKIADNTVTLAKMSTGTAGAIVAYSSLGSFGEVSVGSVGQALMSNGAGIPPTFQAGGILIQSVTSTYATRSDHTTVIPVDDSVPSSTEGDEIVTATITPKSDSSKLRITAHVPFTVATGAATATVSILRDASTSAIAAKGHTIALLDHLGDIPLIHEVSVGSTAETTIKLRFGPAGAFTARLNGTATRVYGGVSEVILSVDEIT